MFLSKFFKFTRGKALIAFAGLAMALGVTGAISTVAATQQNEVVETKAAGTTTASHMVIWLIDEIGFTGNNNDPYVHFTVTTYADGFAYNSVADVAANIDGFSLGSDGASLDVGMTWETNVYDGNKRAYKWEAPWYFTKINAYFCNHAKNWYSNSYTTCSAGTDYRIYIYGSGDLSTGYSTTAGSITVTTYTASFNTNGGTSVSSQTKKEHGKYTTPSSPTKTGYTFSKWTETNSGSATAVTFPVPVTADKTYYAQWSADTYTISFNKNADDATGSTASVTATYGAEQTLTSNGFSRSGYNFTGWATSSSGAKVYDDGATLTASQVNAAYTAAGGKGKTYTLYAVWEAVPTYTVTFVIADGQSSYGALSSTEISGVNSGTAINVSSNTVTIAGTTVTATPTTAGAQYTYAFGSWSNTAGTVTADRTITANFTRTTNQYTITWVDGDGNTLDTDTLDYGATPSYSGATPTKTSTAQYDYTFNDTWSPAITTVTGDATYTAQFDSTVRKYTVTWKNWDGTTLETDENVSYGATPTYDGSTPTRSATATYSYAFTGWSPAVGAITGNTTYTAQFSSTRVSYNLTYKYLDADGVSIKDATVTPTANGSTVTLPTPSKDGYSFVRWYESDGFSGTEREAGYEFIMPTSAKTFTAKFERNGFYLVDTDNGFTANASSYGSESAGVWTWSGVELDADEMLKIRYIGPDHSYEDGGWLGYNRLSSSSTAYTNFTQVIGGDDNNNIKATESGTFDIRFVVGASDSAGAIFIDWHPAFTQGYYVVGDETFNASHPWSVEGGIQLTHETSGSDLAAGTNISIPAGASFALTKYVDGHNDVWYNTWASFPDSCETVTGDQGALNLHYKGTETAVFNVYLNKDGEIYIVDQTVIAKAGYIYYASDSAKSAITLTVTNKNSEQSFPEGKHLSDVSDVLTDNNVSAFDSKTNLYKIPFYNLRGVLVTSEIATIVIGGSTINVSSVSQSESKSYYISSASISEDKGAAAKAVFDLDQAMNGKSICDMDASWSSLKSSIETGYSGDATLMSNAKILTCASEGDKETFTTEWNVSDIYKEICRQLGVATGIPAWPLSSFIIPGGPKGNESPLTLTLWIVLGAGILGMGAIGTAYFISKKKKRHQA